MSNIAWKMGIFLLLMFLLIITLGIFLNFNSGGQVLFSSKGQGIIIPEFLWILLPLIAVIWLLGDRLLIRKAKKH